jgi:predicted Zn-dependent protease
MPCRTIVVALAAALLLPRVCASSVAEEQRLGRRFALEAASKLPMVTDAAVVEFVEDVGGRLVASIGRQPFDYHFYVIAHPALNAFAVPGGYVYVHSGLIVRAASVDELASVLGHEIAHVHAHHIVRRQERTQLWSYAQLLGVLLSAVQPVLGAGAIAAAAAAQLKYSREFEEEADYLGLRFMHTAGYDTAAMPSFFKKILAEQRLNPAGVPPYLLTHPLTEDRIAKVETSRANLRLEPAARAPTRRLELEESRAILAAETTASPEIVLAEYRRRAEATPEDGFSQYLLGIVYAAVGRLDAARVALERAKDLPGAGRRLPVRLAGIYLRLGRASDAEAMLQRYLVANGNDGEARGLLGQTFIELGESERAKQELERSIALAPGLDESHRLLGQTYGRMGRSGEAFYHLGRAFELRGKLEQAHSQYVRARDALGEGDPRAEAIGASIAELSEVIADTQRDERQR